MVIVPDLTRDEIMRTVQQRGDVPINDLVLTLHIAHPEMTPASIKSAILPLITGGKLELTGGRMLRVRY